MISDQIRTRPGDQRRQPLEEFPRLKRQMSGAVAPWRLELKADMAIVEEFEALV
jgi:hypothetical protein